MDELIRPIQEEVLPWSMLFIDNIVLMDGTRHGVNAAELKIWKDSLESKSFRLRMYKTKYMECKFSKSKNKDEGVENLMVRRYQRMNAFDILD